jgi:type VI secretion system protein VasI
MSKVFLSAFVLVLSSFPQLTWAQDECISIAEDSARLACFDIAFGSKEVTTTTSNDNGKWRISVESSALTDDKSIFLGLDSNDDVKTKYGPAGPATLILRCMENTTAAVFRFNGHHMADLQSYGIIEYRLDKKPMSKLRTQQSTDNKALGLWSGAKAIPFAKSLIGHETLVLRATPYSESPIVSTFDIRGIDNAIAELRETCNW